MGRLAEGERQHLLVVGVHELEGVGAGDAEELSAGEGGLEFATFLGEVAAAVGLDAGAEVGGGVGECQVSDASQIDVRF